MKRLLINTLLLVAIFTACDEREPDVEPLDENYPFRLVMDTDEGAALADAEDYGLEVAFADYLGDLPSKSITLNYEFSDMEDSFVGAVSVDEVVYKVEIDDCEYEREIEFTDSQITIPVDPDLGTVPEEFEIVFALPGLEDTEGGFAFELTNISTDAEVLLNQGSKFEYEVLDAEVAGDWELTLTEEEFEDFKSFFSMINEELSEVAYSDFEDGKVAVEFEFKEMKFEIELLEEEEVCEDGETEIEAKTVEIEFEWDVDDEEKEIELEGKRTFDDDGITAELDVIVEADYEINGDQLVITFTKLLDEDNYEEGEELFAGEQSFTLIRD